MKAEQICADWKKRKGQIETERDYSEKVMERIHQYEQSRSRPLFDSRRFVEVISAHPLAKVALIISGAVTGLVRLVFIIVAILGGGTVSG